MSKIASLDRNAPFILFFSLIVTAAFAAPQAAIAPPDPEPSILTSFKFAGCSDDQTTILNQDVNDAVTLASTGLDYINELVVTYPSYGHQQVNFSKQAAIDFFGPESQNLPYQQFIFGRLHAGKRLETLIFDTLLLLLHSLSWDISVVAKRDSLIDAMFKAANAYLG